MKAFSSIIEAIGQTPLVELSRLTGGLEGRILAKIEFLNPGLSKKDRVALQIIEEAENAGTILPGQTVIELTSGNTGTGLAIVCAIKGYPFVAVMSKGNSPERARMMAALGAEVVLVDQAGSVDGQVTGEDLLLVENETERLVRERAAFRADQFRNESNFRAHFLHTGPEMIAQAGDRIDAFCDYVGTGGSLAGCAAALKAHDATTRCYAVEPSGAAVLAGQPVTDPKHRIQGGGYAINDLALLKAGCIDGYLQVSDQEAIDTARRLAREEGIFGGFSAGANAAAALHLLQDSHRGGTVAILIPDSGLKYLSTDLWP